MKVSTAARTRTWLMAACLCAFSSVSQAQVNPDWSATTAGVGGSMVSVDSESNALVVGTPSGGKILVTKQSPAGAQLWQRLFDAPGQLTRSSSIATDAQNNVLVSGVLLTSTGGANGLVTLKYDAQGTLLWQDLLPSAQGQAIRAIADAAGNVYTLGLTASITGFGLDISVVKYSAAGARLWVKPLSASMIAADAIAIAPNGNVLVTGRTSAQTLLAAIDTAGNQIALKSIPTSGSGSDVAVTKDGVIYVVGGDISGLGGGFTAAKYDTLFTELWRNTYPARGPAMRAAVDSAGNLIIIGSTNTNTGPLTVVLYDWMIMKVDPSGALLWSRAYGENDAETPFAVAVGADDSIYVTGEGRGLLADAGGNFFLPSALTLKLRPDGIIDWTANATATSLQAASFYRGVGLTLGNDGGVYVVNYWPQVLYRYPQSGAANVPPIALASAMPTTGTAPLAVSFTAASSVDPDGRIATYAWDFGDGQTSSLMNPTHTYAVGIFNARVTVTDTLGASTTSTPITVTANAQALIKPTSLILARSVVTGGKSTTATVKVSGSNGVTLKLSSSNPLVASVPASVVVPKGATSVSFTIKTTKVRRQTAVTIGATANGVTTSAVLTVQ